MVQSARVQKIVKGDDVSLTHQIMEDIAYNAELSRAPITLNEGDTVNFFYPMQRFPFNPPLPCPPNPPCGPEIDLIGYPGVAATSYPASLFTVAIPGLIVDPADLAPNRGTSTFQSGLGRTVRAEITRLVLSTTGNTTISENVIAGLASTAGLMIGQSIFGVGIPARTVIENISGSNVTMSANATATATGVTLVFGSKESHYSIDEVDIFERGFPSSLCDTTGGVNPPPPPINLT